MSAQPSILEVVKNAFEPQAKPLQGPLDVIAQASIAISLKRLADVADKLTASDHDTRVDLTNFVQHLAWEAGRSFQHGTRTDR